MAERSERKKLQNRLNQRALSKPSPLKLAAIVQEKSLTQSAS
jgi:hypothetical protein